MTINQLLKQKRPTKLHKFKTPKLQGCPQKKGICRKVFITTPKKPNSAQRKATKVWFLSTDESTTAYIPGIGHSLQTHASVLVRGGRVKDLPGVRYKVVRGKYDARPVANRRQGRSIYGVKGFNIKKKKNYK